MTRLYTRHPGGKYRNVCVNAGVAFIYHRNLSYTEKFLASSDTCIKRQDLRKTSIIFEILIHNPLGLICLFILTTTGTNPLNGTVHFTHACHSQGYQISTHERATSLVRNLPGAAFVYTYSYIYIERRY